MLLFFVLGFGVQPASAHVSPHHAELVVSTKHHVTSGRLIVHRDVVSPDKAGAWASRLLTASCPASGSGVAGDSGGVPGGVVVELAWSCHVDRLDLTSMLKEGGLTQAVVEFDGNTVDATTVAPVVDASGAHEGPASTAFPWRTVMLGVALAVVALQALRWALRRRPRHRPHQPTHPSPHPRQSPQSVGRARRRRQQLIAAGAAVVAGLVPYATAGTSFAADETAAAAANGAPVSVQGTAFKDVNRNGVRDGGEAPMPGVDVTDGAVWTTTGADGSYTLRMDPGRRETDLVSVVSPNGYTPALRKDYIPQFFHKVPDGDGPHTGIDFALVPDRNAANPTEKWVMDSDVEVSNTSDEAARKTLPQWTGQVEAMSEVDGATMAIATGDLTVTDYAQEPRRQAGLRHPAQGPDRRKTRYALLSDGR